MITRLAALGDAAAIAEIHVQSWQRAYRGLLPQDFLDSLNPTQRTARWRDFITNQDPPGTAVVVIADHEKIHGFGHVCPSRDDDEQRPLVGELASIYLRPNTWGQGLGRQLIGHCLGLLTEAGNTAAMLWVLEGNARAIRFYEANGWRPNGATKHATIAQTLVTEIRYRIAL